MHYWSITHTMHIPIKARWIIVLTVLIIMAFGGQAREAHARDFSDCYSYGGLGYTTPTVSVNLRTSSGQASTISIPNQSTPSILQMMVFTANSNCGSYVYGFNGQSAPAVIMMYDFGSYGYNYNYSLNFVTSSGSTIPFNGSPWGFYPDSSAAYLTDSTTGYLNWEEMFDIWYYTGYTGYNGLNDMGYSVSTEDAVINNIASTGNFTNQVTVPSGSFATVSAPATNCAQLSGTGGTNVVFMRDPNYYPSVSDFILQARALRDEMLSEYPYSSNPSAYSFYLDLKKQANPNGAGSVILQPNNYNYNGSSCSGYDYDWVVPTPTASSINGTGLTYQIGGSGFSPAGNTVQFVNTANSSIVWTQGAISSNGTSLTLTIPPSTLPDGNYSVKVWANASLHSNLLSTYLVNPVTIPTPTLTSASVSGGIVTVNGSNMSTTGNTVQISGSGVSTVTLSNISSSGGTSMTFTLPTADNTAGTYSVKVEASGGTAYSNAVSFTVVAPGVAPTNLAATRSTSNLDQINLSWSETDTTVTGYSIERSFAASGGYTVVGTVSGASNRSYLDDLSNTTITGANDLYRVRSKYADGTYSAYSNITTVSNCISEGGTGNVAIAFERGDGWGPNPVSAGQTLIDNSTDYLTTVTNIMNVIKNTNPFKSYGGNISFLADLQQISQSSLWNSGDVSLSSSGAAYYNSAASGIVKSTSSCQATVYITLINTNNIYYAYTDSLRVLYLNVANSHFSNPTNYANLGHVATHELGHALSTLNDEYSPNEKGNVSFKDVTTGVPFFLENCTQDPYASYSDASGKLYGSVFGDVGCGTYKTDTNSYPWLRSSADSIMNLAGSGTADNERFNTISCGWIIAALDGQPMTQTNAATHFAECSNMDGIAGTGEFPVNSKPPVVITVGGFTAGGTVPSLGNAIFDTMDRILPSEVSSIHVPTNFHSTANLTSTVVQDVNNALSQGRPAIVVGFSLGSLIVFNLRNDFPGQNVQFIYVDPPYAYSPFFAGFASAFNRGLYSSVVSAVKNGIAKDPNSIIWTNGAGISNFHNHDPFYYSGANEPVAPNGLSNKQNLINFQNTILADLGKASTSTLGFSPIANATPASPTITLTGIESGGNLVTSIAPGDTVSLTGTGFDPNANDIHIEDVNDPTVYYDFYSYAPDSNGNLTFTLPPYFDLSDSGGAADTVPDTYFIQVAGYSSNWSNIGTVQVTTTSVPPPVPGAITTDPTIPNQFILAGSGFSATGNSVGLTAQSVALTTPQTGSFNLASALGGFWQAVTGVFTGNTTHKQISVASIPATQKTVTTTATKTTSSKTSSKTTTTTSKVVTSSAVTKTATATTSTPDYIITGLPSSGSGVTFQIPGGMPNGVYTVSVRSLNTPWVTTSNAIAVSNNSSGIGATSNTSTTTANLTCPTGYTLSGSTCNPNLMPVSFQVSQSSGSIVLSWTNPAYAVSATGISIESAQSASGPFSVIGTVSASTNTFTDTGASSGQMEYYRIQATFNGGLYGPYTNIVSIVTITSAVPNPASPNFLITGTSFSQTGNSVGLSATSATSPQYTITGLSSSDESTIAFQVPATVPGGTYKLYIQTAGSTWIMTSSVIIVTNTGTGGGGGTGTGTTGPGTSGSLPSTVPVKPSIAATANYSCPNGGSLSGTSCNVAAHSISANVSYSCSDGSGVSYGSYEDSSSNWHNGAYCHGAYTATTYAASASYSCPSGDSMNSDGTSCTVPASSYTATTIYSCPANYSLSGSTCNPTAAYICPLPTGYTVSGSNCVPNLTPTNFKISAGSAANAGSITISWSNPSYALTLSGMIVEYGTSPSAMTPVSTDSSSATSHTGTGFPPSTTAYYRIHAQFSNGATGPYTSILSASTPATPSAPNFKVASSGTSATLILTWPNQGVVSYSIYKYPSATIVTTTSALTYTINNLLYNTQYCYTMSAYNNAAYFSGMSGSVCGTTGGYPTPTVTATTPQQGAVALSIPIATMSTSAGVSIVGTAVERSTSSTTGFVSIATTTTASYTDIGLPAATKYFYRSEYILSNGRVGSSSPVVSATTLTPATPSSVAAKAASPLSINLTWTDADKGVAQYKVMQVSPTATTSIATTTSLLINGLLPSTQYCYTVTAYINPLNSSATSAQACVTTPSLPAAKKITASNSVSGQIALSWNNNSATGFSAVSVERSIAKSSGYIQIGTTTGTTFTDIGLPPSTQYYYSVRFMYGYAGFGPYAGTSSVKTAATGKPSSFKATASTSSAIGLSWKDTNKVVIGYLVSEVSPSVISATTTATSYYFTNLIPATKYCFTVAAIVNPVNTSAPTGKACITTKKASTTANVKNNVAVQTTTVTVPDDASSDTTFTDTTSTTDTTATDVTTSDMTATTSVTTTSTGTTAISTTSSTVATSTKPTTTKNPVLTPAQILQNLLNGKKQGTTITATTTSVDIVQPVVVTTPVNTIVPVSVPTSVPATVTYSCVSSDYILNGSQCTLTTTIPATAKTGCPTGYTFINQKCARVSPLSIITPTTVYSCTSGYTLNTDGTTCSSSSVTVPATATYSCPTGYLLDNATKTCTQSTSAAFATSTTTASVFDSITHWFGSFFGW